MGIFIKYLWAVSMVAMSSILLHAQQASDSTTIAVTGWFDERYPQVDIGSEVQNYIFVKEKAQVAFFNNYAPIKGYYMTLDEETSQRMGRSQVVVVFVNDLDKEYLQYEYQTEEKPITLNLVPLDRERIPYLYYYKDESLVSPKQGVLYTKITELKQFMDNPKVGDTLRYSLDWIDTRYTPQLVKALGNNSSIIIESPIFDANGYVYMPKKMSEIAREQLGKLFTSRVKRLDLNSPVASAPQEEWQAWLNSLPQLLQLRDVEDGILADVSWMKDRRPQRYGYPTLPKLAAVEYDPITGFLYTHDSQSMYAFDTKKDTALILDIVNLPVGSTAAQSDEQGGAVRNSAQPSHPIADRFIQILNLPNGNMVTASIEHTPIQELLMLRMVTANAQSTPKPVCVATHIPLDNSMDGVRMQLIGLCHLNDFYYISYRIKEALIWCKVPESSLAQSSIIEFRHITQLGFAE